MKSRYLALAALLVPALPAQAQTGMEAFNPFAMLAPIMTPMGAMLVPMMAPMNNPTNMFNPATMFNPAAITNPMAMMPTMPNMQIPAMPAMPNFAAPQGMAPFTGLQATPQSYGMAPAQMANPFVVPQMATPYMANPYAAMPFAFPSMPAQAGFPALPNFPLMFPPAR